MTTTPFSTQQSEQWLLERTYHARLQNGRELAVPALTEAMQQLSDFTTPLSAQSWKSRLAERIPSKKSSNFSVPISTWQEITQEEAYANYQQGKSVLLYGQHTWEHQQGAQEAWQPSKNMRKIIYGEMALQPEVASGANVAVCYLDKQHGTFSNAAWKDWFPADASMLLDGTIASEITFLGPSYQFPFTTHYTVLTSDRHVHEYAGEAEALAGFQDFSSHQVRNGSQAQAIFPQFSYYHDVTCPSGVYRLEFFGPHLDEPGYAIKEALVALPG